MNDRGPFLAAVAALIVGTAYASGGIPKQLAGVLLLFILIVPGPTGRSMLYELVNYTNDRLMKGL